MRQAPNFYIIMEVDMSELKRNLFRIVLLFSLAIMPFAINNLPAAKHGGGGHHGGKHFGGHHHRHGGHGHHQHRGWGGGGYNWNSGGYPSYYYNSSPYYRSYNYSDPYYYYYYPRSGFSFSLG